MPKIANALPNTEHSNEFYNFLTSGRPRFTCHTLAIQHARTVTHSARISRVRVEIVSTLKLHTRMYCDTPNNIAVHSSSSPSRDAHVIYDHHNQQRLLRPKTPPPPPFSYTHPPKELRRIISRNTVSPFVYACVRSYGQHHFHLRARRYQFCFVFYIALNGLCGLPLNRTAEISEWA